LQSPPGLGSGGLGQSTLVAASAMVPFSLLSVASSQVLPRLLGFRDDSWLLATGFVFFAISSVGLGWFRGNTLSVFLIMGICGMGAGCTFSAMPSIIVRAVPGGEVGSAMGFNQVLRTVGYSTGSAASAAVLAAHVAPGTIVTEPAGYDAVAVVGLGVFTVGAIASVILGLAPRGVRRMRRPEDDLLAPPEP
jgi:hypothetical protein